MKRILWAFVLGILLLLPMQAWGKPEAASEDIKFEQGQYDMLMRCSEKGDVTEWNAWVKQNMKDSFSPPGIPILLQGADFRKANLRGAILRSAQLQGANFYGADLTGAILQYANLKGTNFNSAILVKAHLGNSLREGTNFHNANMTEAQVYYGLVDF